MTAAPDTRTSTPAGTLSRRLRGGANRIPRAWAIPAATGLAAFSFAALILAWGAHDRPILHVDATFSASACCSWQVWVNGANPRDITIFPVSAGRQVYDVPLITPTISRLRMRAGQARGGTIVLNRLWITRGSRTVADVDPKTLAITSYFAKRDLTAQGAAFTATHSDPFLDMPVSLASGESRFRVFVARVEADPVTTLAGLLLAGCIAMTIVAKRRREWTLVASLILTMVLVRAMLSLSWRLPLRDSVRQAVSFASYQGLWKTRERFVLDAAAAVGFLVPAAVVYGRGVWRRLSGVGVEASRDPDVRVERSSRRLAAALIVVPTLLVGLAGAPNLRLLIGGPPRYAPSWDANNLVFWHYLIASKGLAPMKDFFWPYGFQWLFDKSVPWGDVMSYVTYLSLWALLAIGAYFTLARFFGGRGLVVRYLLLSGLWVSASISSYTLYATRYIAPLAVVLLYTAIETDARALSWKRLLFAGGLLELALFEFAQLAYAIVPIALLVAAQIAFHVRRDRDEWRRLGTALGVSVAAPLGLAALVYWAAGELRGAVDYYGQLGALTSAYGLPGQLDAWVTHPYSLEGGLFWSVPIVIAAGVHGVFARHGRLRELYLALAALGVLGLMIMQKQALRPSIAQQIWFPVLFPLAFWAVVEARLASVRRWSTVTAIAGAIAAVVLVAGGYRTGWHAVVGGPRHLTASVDALVTDQSAFAATARKAYVPAAFAKFTQYKPVVRALDGMPVTRTDAPIWILGDDSPIIMMLGHSWPYYFNDYYDAAPIAFQRKVLATLADHPPALAVWNFAPGAMTFDTVPNVVRSPLIFQWALAHLTPERTVGTFAILRPRRAGEPVRLSWWRRRIGGAVDLGHIPVVATMPGGSCATACDSFLVATVPSGRPIPAAFSVPIRADGLDFTVQFAASPGVRRYVVPLDRLWFWKAARSHTVVTRSASGYVLTVEKRPSDRDALY